MFFYLANVVSDFAPQVGFEKSKSKQGVFLHIDAFDFLKTS